MEPLDTEEQYYDDGSKDYWSTQSSNDAEDISTAAITNKSPYSPQLLANNTQSVEYRIWKIPYEWCKTQAIVQVPKVMNENDFLQFNSLTIINRTPNNFTVSLSNFDFIYPHFDLDVKRINPCSKSDYRKILYELISVVRNILCQYFINISEDDIDVFTRSDGMCGGIHFQIKNYKISTEYLQEQIANLESLLNVKLYDRKTFQFQYRDVQIKLDKPSNISLLGFSKTGKIIDCYRHIHSQELERFPYDEHLQSCNIIEVRKRFELPVGNNAEEKLLIDLFAAMSKEGKTSMKFSETTLDFILFSTLDLYNQLSWKQYQIDYIIVLYFYKHCETFTFNTYLWLCDIFQWSNDTFQSLEKIQQLAKLMNHLEFIGQHHTFAPILLVILLQTPNYWDPLQAQYQLNIKCMKSEYCSINMINMLKEMNQTRFNYLDKLALQNSVDDSVTENNFTTITNNNVFPFPSTCYDDSQNATLETLLGNGKKRSIAAANSSSLIKNKRAKLSLNESKLSWAIFLKAAEKVLNKLFIAFERKVQDKTIITLWFFGQWHDFDSKFLSHIYGELLNVAIEDVSIDNFTKAITKNCQSWYAMRSYNMPSEVTLNFQDKIFYHLDSKLFLPTTVPMLVMKVPQFGIDSRFFRYGLENSHDLFRKYFTLLYGPLQVKNTLHNNDDNDNDDVGDDDDNKSSASYSSSRSNHQPIERYFFIMLRYVFTYMSGNWVKMFTLLWYLANFATFRESKTILHWFGPLASNGKTFLLMALRLPMGSYMNAISMSSVKNANKDTHPDLVKAKKGSIIYLDEGTSTEKDYNVQALKVLTGGSCQYIRSLHENGGETQFQFNFITTGNKEFGSLDDNGFQTRLTTIPFNTIIGPQYKAINCYDPSLKTWYDSMSLIFRRHVSFTKGNLTTDQIKETIGLGFMIFFGMCENQELVDKSYQTILRYDAKQTIMKLMWKKIIPATGHHETLQHFSTVVYDLLLEHYAYLPKQYFEFMHREVLELFQKSDAIEYWNNKFYNIQLKVLPILGED